MLSFIDEVWACCVSSIWFGYIELRRYGSRMLRFVEMIWVCWVLSIWFGYVEFCRHHMVCACCVSSMWSVWVCWVLTIWFRHIAFRQYDSGTLHFINMVCVNNVKKERVLKQKSDRVNRTHYRGLGCLKQTENREKAPSVGLEPVPCTWQPQSATAKPVCQMLIIAAWNGIHIISRISKYI